MLLEFYIWPEGSQHEISSSNVYQPDTPSNITAIPDLVNHLQAADKIEKNMFIPLCVCYFYLPEFILLCVYNIYVTEFHQNCSKNAKPQFNWERLHENSHDAVRGKKQGAYTTTCRNQHKHYLSCPQHWLSCSQHCVINHQPNCFLINYRKVVLV